MRSSAEATSLGRIHHSARGESTAVSAVLAHAVLDAAEAKGACRQTVEAAAGCALGERSLQGEWIELERFSRLLVAAMTQTGDPALGLHWGEHAPLTNFGIVTSLAHWAPNPREALLALMRFQGLLFLGKPVASLQVRGASAALRCELQLPNRDAQRIWVEFVVVGATVLLQQLCGRSGAAVRVSFDYAAPPYAQEYQRLLGDAIVFDAPTCTLELDAGLLDTALPQFNPRLSEAVEFEASCALARIGGQGRCSALVREQLASACSGEACMGVQSMDEVARKLGMSTRTLRRRLEQEGTAFPELAAQALRDRALRLLSHPQSSVKEVAYALGFATPSAFHRAFKRWTGSSPSEVLQQRGPFGSAARMD